MTTSPPTDSTTNWQTERHELRFVLWASFLFGAVVAGLPIAFAHALHNDLASPWEGLLLGVVCTVVYGGWCAASLALARFVWRPLRRLFSGWRRPRLDDVAPDGMTLGLTFFGWTFTTGFLLHGLTYDQVPGGPPTGPAGVVAYAVLVALATLAACALAARWIAPGLRSLSGRPRVAAVLLVLAVALPSLWASQRALSMPPVTSTATPNPTELTEPTEPTIPPPGVTVRETGVGPVALVALDGADWQILTPLIERGELPAFARLIADGVSGPLHTLADSNSAVIWASIYTGKRPADHGILDFFRVRWLGMPRGFFPVHRTYFKEAADYGSIAGLASFRQMARFDLADPPIWEITDRSGLATGLVDGYYYSFPAPQPRSGGYAIAYGADGFAAQLDEPARAQRADDVPLFVQPPEMFRELRDALRQGHDFDWQSSVTRHLLASRPVPRFLSFYTHEPDTVQHRYWKWHQPEKYLWVEDADVVAHGDRIHERYRAFDAFLAALRERLGPEALIIVTSDHGHSPTIFHQNYFTQHRHGPPGVLIAAGGPLRRGLAVSDASIYDLFPSLLHVLGLPVPSDAVGKVRLDWFDDGFGERFPVARIPTYRGLWTPDGVAGVKSGLEGEEIEKLRALGYL